MTCAFAVRGALKKFPGVESVDVSLNKGLATVKLKPGNAVSAEQLWDAVKKNGFTPKATHVVARGAVFESAGKLMLKVTGANSYELIKVDAKQFSGKTVNVEGVLTPAKDLKTQVPLQVQSIHDASH